MKQLNNSIIPFSIGTSCQKLTLRYPTPTDLRQAFLCATDTERDGIIRLWMTEGIPFAFAGQPLLYEEIRQFMATNVKIYPKDITMVGSGRIGYSLKPKVWGKVFSNSSDLDFTIVSRQLFADLEQDFKLWSEDLRLRKINVASKRELTNWLKSIDTLHRNIPKGYMQLRDFPSNSRYPTASRCFSTIQSLKKRVAATTLLSDISDASIRIYPTWGQCIRRIKINMKSALQIK